MSFVVQTNFLMVIGFKVLEIFYYLIKNIISINLYYIGFAVLR